MKIITGAIIAIGLFISGLLVGRYVFYKTEIKVIKETVTKTEYKYKYLKSENKPVFDQENFNRLLYCYDSPLLFEDHTEGNTLHVKAYDECKEATVQYEIGSKGNYKIYLTVGVVGILTGIGLYHFLK